MQYKRFSLWTLGLLAAVLLFSKTAFAQRVVVALNDEEVHVHNNIITIGEVATVTGSPESLVEKIKALDLDQFENQTDVKQISKRFVDIRIRLDRLGDTTTIRGSFTNARLVPRINRRERIEKEVAREIATHYSMPVDKLVVSIPPDTQLPPGNIKKERINIASILPADLKLGPQEILLGLIDPNGFARAEKLNVNVGLVRNLAVANRDIPKGERIGATDIAQKTRVIESLSQTYVPAELVIGKVTQNPIAKYSLIKASDLSDDRLDGTVVKNNDLVDAVMQQGNLRVKLRNVKVLGNGAVNDRVKILNPVTGQTMTARVIDGITVLIE